MMQREFDLFNKHRTMREAEEDAEPALLIETAQQDAMDDMQEEMDEIYFEEM